jgi:prepilin-type N-terminal cleavage/methylation domain-containing protein
MASRRGFTLLEVLIAGALSVFIGGLAIQQIVEYFRLQQVLLARTQLRNDLQNAKERIASHLRQGVELYALPNGYVYAKPIDIDLDGVITQKDQNEVIHWYLGTDPVHPSRTALYERSTRVPAYSWPADPAKQLELFDAAAGRGRMLAPSVAKLEIFNADPAYHMVRIKITASQQVPRQQTPVEVTVSELVAQRSISIAEKLPSVEAVLHDLKEQP